MNPISSSDVSLYELVLRSEAPPSVLQISPATLKSICNSLVNLLIKESTPAIVWAKFPRGDVWRTELNQYASLEGIAQSVYLFVQQRDEAEEANTEEKAIVATAATAKAPILTIQLPPESSLRREYFLIIWSAPFKGGIFAHRPRSVQAFKPPEQTALSFDLLSSYGQTSQLLDSLPERKQLLLALCTFESVLIQQVLQGLEQAIAASALQVRSSSDSASPMHSALAVREVTQHWQNLIAACPATPTSSDFLGQLISSQIQHQEELWQRNSLYRKQAETADSLRLQNEELTNTLRLKDEFLNNVGQELRTPLTTIKTALSLLNSPNIKPPQRQRYMDLITKECDRQSSLITSLLDLAHIEQVAEQAALPPVRLVDVVPGVVSTYQPVAEEKGVRLSYTIPEDLPPVACMTNWLKQIVINLLHNGIKYTPDGGNVWVRAKQQGDYVQLEVRDTGIGIAPAEIPKIFDRFYRVRQSADDSSGAGLGLTIVQQLLLHCGGSISVKSKLAEGSTFNVLLPTYKGPGESAMQE